MQTTVIYPGTFDPFTFGHIDLIERALTIFDHVIVAIATSTPKHTVFTLNERMQLAKEVLAKYPKVSVENFSGLLVDFVKANNTFLVLRGLRAISDFEFEFQIASLNRSMEKRIETIFLMPEEKYAYISASMVREIASFGGDVSGFVPKEIVTALRNKYNK